MSTQEPVADRDGSSAPSGVDSPSRSAVVSGSGSEMAATGSGGGLAAAGGEIGMLGEAAGASADPSRAAEEAEEAGGTEADDTDASSWWSARDLLRIMAVCALTLMLVNAFVARPFAVPSASMENALRPGDRLIVNELAYAFGDQVRRGDVVVFDGTGSFLPYTDETPAVRRFLSAVGLSPGSGSVYVKRVIGIGGDRVTCCGADGRLKVNGIPLDESAYLYAGDVPSAVPFDVVVPAGKLWVMGDHRSDSRDSRDHLGEPGGGFVPEKRVIGRADWVVFPVGRWTSLDRPASFASVEGTGGHGGQG